MPGFLSRRGVLAGAAACAVGAGPHAAVAQEPESIEQPTTINDSTFIARAYRERHEASARGDQTYGAVVVQDGRILGKAGSRVVRDRDPTAHAEMLAIRDALRRTGRADLTGAVLYSSSRACPMCEAAAYFAGIVRMVHGRARDDEGAPQLRRC
ncbi:MAG: nucleoside deaminase [Alphaproteobacteria bacterium]